MNDTLIHTDTIVDGKHKVIDTICKNDTIYIETTTYDKEYEIIEKLIDHKDLVKV